MNLKLLTICLLICGCAEPVQPQSTTDMGFTGAVSTITHDGKVEADHVADAGK